MIFISIFRSVFNHEVLCAVHSKFYFAFKLVQSLLVVLESDRTFDVHNRMGESEWENGWKVFRRLFALHFYELEWEKIKFNNV